MRALLGTFAFFVASVASAGEFDGAWALSGKWTGYMGLALKISGDHYKYCFSSDVGPTTYETTINGKTTRYTEKPPHYPLTGRAVVRGNVLELRGAGDYYDRKWHRIVYRGVPCLLADEHYREWKHDGRLPDESSVVSDPAVRREAPGAKLWWIRALRWIGQSYFTASAEMTRRPNHAMERTAGSLALNF